MKAASRLALFAATIAIAAGSTGTPALAKTSKWSKSQCTAYAKKYTKSSKSQKSAANKTLKSHGCTNKVA